MGSEINFLNPFHANFKFRNIHNKILWLARLRFLLEITEFKTRRDLWQHWVIGRARTRPSVSYFPISVFSLLRKVFLSDSVVKSSPANAGHAGLIPRLGRSTGEGNDNPLWYSCLGNPTERGAWWATVYGVAQSWTQLSTRHKTYCLY